MLRYRARMVLQAPASQPASQPVSQSKSGGEAGTVEGNLCIEEASKSRIGRWRGDLVVVSRRRWWRRPVGRPSTSTGHKPLDLSLFIGARIAISGDTEEFEEVRTAVHL